MTRDGEAPDGSARGEDLAWLSQYYTPTKTSSGPENDGAPLDLADRFAPSGAAKYALGAELGRGGMKRVLRARDRNADRDVALAVLGEEAARAGELRRFVREARITAALEHPNIVPVHDLGLDAEGRPYFTMKLLGGENLHDVLTRLREGDPEMRRRYPLERRLRIFQDVCNAVAFAHARGVLHLDLKPANVQVGHFGETLVLDWGLARLAAPPAGAGPAIELPAWLHDVPAAGVVRGTPGYMAPEQAAGEFAALDERADVYALGALLHALITLRTPPKPGTAAGRARSFWRPAPAARAADGARVPRALEAIARRAMALAPADRYAQVMALQRDIEAHLAGRAPEAQPAGLLTLLGLLIRRHLGAATVAFVSLLTILALLAGFLVRLGQSERRARAALLRVQAEQENRRQIGLLAAPQQLRKAQRFAAEYRFAEAGQALEFCVNLDPALRDAWRLKGCLHLGRLEFAEAAQALARVAPPAATPGPPGPHAGRREPELRAVELARRHAAQPPLRLVPEARPALLALARELADPRLDLGAGERRLALGALFQRANRALPLDGAHLAFVRDALKLLGPRGGGHVRVDLRGRDVAFGLRGRQVADLLPLAGLPVVSLDLEDTEVEDLGPVRDAPLAELRLVASPRVRPRDVAALPRLERLAASPDLAAGLARAFAEADRERDAF